MAFKPSMRSKNKVQEIPLDIRPVMNLMVVLIPILLYSAEFVKLSIRELNLPPAARKGPGDSAGDNIEKEKRFQLTVILSKSGFYIGNKAGYLTGEANTESEPTIAILEDGTYDYVALQEQLIEIKDKIKDQGFIDEKSIIISAEADIEYKHIIKTVDNVTVFEAVDGNLEELFPQINIGQVII